MKKFTFVEKRLFSVLSLAVILSLLLGIIGTFPVVAGESTQSSASAGGYVILDADYLNENLEKNQEVSTTLANWNYIHYALREDGHKYVRFKMLNKDGEKHNDPYIGLNLNGNYSADVYKYVTVIAKTDEKPSAGVSRGGVNFQIFFDTTDDGGYAEKKSNTVGYEAITGYQVLTFDFSNNAQWTGDLNRLRLDIYSGGVFGKGDYCDIAAIILNKDANAVYDSAYEVLGKIYPAKQVLSNFTEEDLPSFSGGEDGSKYASDVSVSIKDGNVRYDSSPDYGDPYASFFYKKLMDARGIDAKDRLTADDFKYTLIRYRTAYSVANPVMQLFVYTGEHYVPFKNSANKFQNPAVRYAPTINNNWQSMVIQMDGVVEAADVWTGDFNGFRVDWCNSSSHGEYIEISDFMFYEDGAAANDMSAAINTLNLAIPSNDVTHDGSYATPLNPKDTYSVLWADEINKGIVDSEGSSHYLMNEGVMSAVRLEVLTKSDAPSVELNLTPQNADKYKFVNILVRTNVSSNPAFSLYYADQSGTFDPGHLSSTRYASTKGWQILTFNFSELSSWSGNLNKFRLNFLCGGPFYSAGTGCEIAGMAFCEDYEAVYDSAYYLAAKAYNPVQVLTDFTPDDIKYFQTGDKEGNTSLRSENGNLIYTATGTGDPQKTFNYEAYAEYKGYKPVTTDVFRYTVIRHRSQGVTQPTFELFYRTGDAKDLWDMARFDYYDKNGVRKFAIHCSAESYSSKTTWGCTVLDMAETDGLKENTKLMNGWHREDGNTRFQGFRFDWCQSGVVGSFLEVSDFIFFADAASANEFARTINNITIPMSYTDIDPDGPGGGGEDIPSDDETTEDTTEETVPDFEDSEESTSEEEPPEIPTFPGDDTSDTEPEVPTFPGDDTDDTDPEIPTFPDDDDDSEEESEITSDTEPDETESESESDETEPEDDESSSSEESESDESSDSETDSSETESESTDTDGEGSSSDETESESKEPDDGETTGNGGMPGTDIEIDGIGTDTGADSDANKGSEVPFNIACISLAGLSVASIATVISIRIKMKKEESN